MNNVHYSSLSNFWETPNWLFNLLNQEFNFDFDAAANKENTKLSNFISEEQDSLIQDWSKFGKTAFLNPPYGRLIGKFVKKAYEESFNGITTVLLIPSRTDTKWFFDYCSKGQIRFIKGRLKFVNKSFPSYRENGDFKISPAPFPSCIVIFKKDMIPEIKWIDYKEYKI